MSKDAVDRLINRVGRGFAFVPGNYRSVEDRLLELLDLNPLPEVVLRIDRIICSSPIVLLRMVGQGRERLVVFLLFQGTCWLSLEARAVAWPLVRDVVRLLHLL